MIHRLIVCLVICASTLAAPRRAAATIATITFDTVDAVELNVDCCNGMVNLLVTGILVGGSTPTTRTFVFRNESTIDTAASLRCERFALIAMAKPGKYQFSIGSVGSSAACRLVLRTP